MTTRARFLVSCCLAALISAGGSLHAQNLPTTEGPLGTAAIEALARANLPDRVASSDLPWRVSVEVGQLDPRLRLAPCQKIQPYVPPGARMWGKTRIGLRCVQGERPWNVYLPIQVKVMGTGAVATVALAAGEALTARHLIQAEVNLAEEDSEAVLDPATVLGRILTKPLAPGQSLRVSHLRPRVWFTSGDDIQVLARGEGYLVQGQAQAMSPGVEGQPARVRTGDGRVITVWPTGARQAEIRL